MGAKDWMLMYAEGTIAEVLRTHPQPDRAATRALVERLHPETLLTAVTDGNLLENPNPPDGLVYAGVYPGLTVLCSGTVALDRPSTLPAKYLAEANGRTVYLHATHSVVDWFAYAIWAPDGTLTRSLSLAPDDGVMENIGQPLPFEHAYWAGEHPLVAGDPVPVSRAYLPGRSPATPDSPPPMPSEGADSYPLPFHPLELSEAALRTLFGFVYEGQLLDDDPELEEITLLGYRSAG
ncbi:DUF6928 family protein [Kribbella sp. NPDC051620]|uniref:DUF6928 family protein n=1 Tax=Kribbella sp. NPDC051620 TaxID=3364120 RepID=UPI00378B3372